MQRTRAIAETHCAGEDEPQLGARLHPQSCGLAQRCCNAKA
jgi:hypothetical protein